MKRNDEMHIDEILMILFFELEFIIFMIFFKSIIFFGLHTHKARQKEREREREAQVKCQFG